MSLKVYTTEHNDQFLCTKEQSDILDTLRELNRGGIGAVHGYVPTSGYDVSPELDLQIITRISTNALYERKIAALESIQFSDIASELAQHPKLAALTFREAEDLFNLRKQSNIDSMKKTLSGDRSGAAREGHDRNNISVCQGVKVNLEGTKVDGAKVPTLYPAPNGKKLPKCESILLSYLEISRTIVKPGQLKVVNSGAPVLMSDLIESKLNKKSVGLKTLSLDPSKFKRIVVAKKEILKEDLVNATKDLTIADMIMYLLQQYDNEQNTTSKIINHIIYVLDCSSSMHDHLTSARKVLTASLDAIKNTSKSMGHETYVSLYTFADNVVRLFFDRPIETVNLDNINFRAQGMTALIDATMTPILDGCQTQVDRVKKENHAYLLNVITDGEENRSRSKAYDLVQVINKLNDEWTLAIQVPNQSGVFHAKNCGFPAGNIQVWDANSRQGLEESTRSFTDSYASYANARSAGFTKSTNYYTVDAVNVGRSAVKADLSEVNGKIYHAQSGPHQIRDFIEQYAKVVYNKGKAYYELVKPELIQSSKGIVIVDKISGKKYGGTNARQLLGIPANNCKVTPGDYGNYRIFVQSTSVNRKVAKGTSVFLED
jgi:hypothetical protein